MLPLRTASNHGVQNGQQLAGDGDEGKLLGLSRSDKTLVVLLEGRIAPGRGDGGHVQGGPYSLPSTPHPPGTPAGAARGGPRSQSDQGGDGAPVELPQLGQ